MPFLRRSLSAMAGLGCSLRPPAAEGEVQELSRNSSGQSMASSAGDSESAHSAESVVRDPPRPQAGEAATDAPDRLRVWRTHSSLQRPLRRLERRSKSFDCIAASQLQQGAHDAAAAAAAKLLPEGMLFGIDIGGTLAKIVFREPHSGQSGPMSLAMAEQVLLLPILLFISSPYYFIYPHTTIYTATLYERVLIPPKTLQYFYCVLILLYILVLLYMNVSSYYYIHLILLYTLLLFPAQIARLNKYFLQCVLILQYTAALYERHLIPHTTIYTATVSCADSALEQVLHGARPLPRRRKEARQV